MNITGNSKLLKDINKTLILNVLREQEPISRTELSKVTKLGIPTVLRNINSLIDEGIIIEIGKGDTSSGRKPTLLKINPSVGYYIGVNIRRKLTLILTDFKGKVLDHCIDYTYTESGPLGIANQIRTIVFKILENNSIPLEKVLGLGAATPGTGFKNNDLISTYGYAGWENADFNKILEDVIPEIPTIAEFITICGAICERWFGSGKKVNNFVYIYADFGVGSGVIVNGQILKGQNGYAGHIGHHSVNFEGELCYCGSRGCLETYTSTIAILKRIKNKLKQGQPSVLRNMIKNIEELTFNYIIEAYKIGDELVVNEIAQAGKIMGIGIANAINMYDPEMVILGGEMFESYPLFMNEAIKFARENTFSLEAKNVNIVPSEIVNSPEALGAIAIMMDEFYKYPEI